MAANDAAYRCAFLLTSKSQGQLSTSRQSAALMACFAYLDIIMVTYSLENEAYRPSCHAQSAGNSSWAGVFLTARQTVMC